VTGESSAGPSVAATEIRLPDPALVVLVGAAGAGKSTFAARHFAADEVISSDALREAVSGDEADQRATRLVFSILHRDVVRRLAAGRSVVVDATNVESHARRALIARAANAGVPAVAIVLALPRDVVSQRNRSRAGRVVDAEIVDRHLGRLATALDSGTIASEGFRAVHVVTTTAALEGIRILREPGAEPDRPVRPDSELAPGQAERRSGADRTSADEHDRDDRDGDPERVAAADRLP
jgi:predicted kinase